MYIVYNNRNNNSNININNIMLINCIYIQRLKRPYTKHFHCLYYIKYKHIKCLKGSYIII